MLTLVRIAWRNLWRGWRRSAIVVTAIAVGLSACLVLIGWTTGMFNQMVDNAVRTHLAHVAVQARGYQTNPDLNIRLPESDGRIAAALEGGPGGVHVAHRVIGDGLIQSSRRSLRAALVGVVAFQEASVSTVPEAIVEGRYLGPQAGRRRVPDIVIGAEMAERLRVGVGDKIVVHVPGETGIGAFRIAGLFRTASSAFDRTFAYVALHDAQRLLGLEDRVSQVAVSLDEPERVDEFRAWAVERVASALPGVEIEVLTWQEREPRLSGMLGIMDQFSWILYAVVFVAMAFGIANALLMAVYERIREFGVLRSLGLQARRLVVLILLEALLLTLFGTVIGLALGMGVVGWLGETGIDLTIFSEALQEYGMGTTLYPEVRREDLLAPIRLAVITALLAALWPAIKVYRLRPAEALRHV